MAWQHSHRQLQLPAPQLLPLLGEHSLHSSRLGGTTKGVPCQAACLLGCPLGADFPIHTAFGSTKPDKSRLCFPICNGCNQLFGLWLP